MYLKIKSQNIFQQEKPLCTSLIVPQCMHVQHPLEAELLKINKNKFCSWKEQVSLWQSREADKGVCPWVMANADFRDVQTFPQGNYQGTV